LLDGIPTRSAEIKTRVELNVTATIIFEVAGTGIQAAGNGREWGQLLRKRGWRGSLSTGWWWRKIVASRRHSVLHRKNYHNINVLHTCKTS